MIEALARYRRLLDERGWDGGGEQLPDFFRWARGASHPNILDESVLAHTSPVYVDVAGRRVARATDARLCLELLDTLEQFVDEHGNFASVTRDAHCGDLVAVLDEARFFYRGVVASANW